MSDLDSNDREWPEVDRRKERHLLIVLIEKYVLPLAILATVTVVSSAVSIWRSVDRLSDQVAQHDKKFIEIESALKAQSTLMVTQPQLLETMKRVEQQMEIVMLRSGAKVQPGSVTLTK